MNHKSQDEKALLCSSGMWQAVGAHRGSSEVQQYSWEIISPGPEQWPAIRAHTHEPWAQPQVTAAVPTVTSFSSTPISTQGRKITQPFQMDAQGKGSPQVPQCPHCPCRRVAAPALAGWLEQSRGSSRCISVSMAKHRHPKVR